MRLIEFIHQGGTIMYILLLINIIGMAMMVYKFLMFSNVGKNTASISSELANKLSTDNANKDQATQMEMCRQELNTYISSVEKGLNTVKIIASVSPLLGLLGTVIGVLSAFQVISQTGLTNPSNFAEGISMALITTVGGLIVAIPHYVGHNYLLGMLDNVEGKLEKEIFSKVL